MINKGTAFAVIPMRQLIGTVPAKTEHLDGSRVVREQRDKFGLRTKPGRYGDFAIRATMSVIMRAIALVRELYLQICPSS